MTRLRQLVLVRHGETDGESSVRYHGSADIALSGEGRAQMQRLAAVLGRCPDLVVASPMRRSFGSAAILAKGAPVRLEPAFREIHFGRWEGLTKEEIRARDPILFEDWQSGAPGFEYPAGESRSGFRERVQAGLDRVLGADASEALLVVHKGVIRTIVELLGREALPPGEPAIGEAVVLTRRPDGTWFRGRRSSNPPALEEEVRTILAG